MTGPTYAAVGRRFHVEVPEGEPRRLVEAALTDLRCTSRNGASGHTVRYWIRPNDEGWFAIGRDHATLRPNTNVEGALGTLLWDINQQALASAEANLVVHAAAVAAGGRGVLLPGASGAGKSTLAAVLVRGGLSYLSDELAIVDPVTWEMQAYPKPITLETGSAKHFTDVLPEVISHVEEHLPASRLRADSVIAAAPAQVMIFPRYRADGPTELRPSGPADSLGRLTVNMMRPRGMAALPALAGLVERCHCFVLDYADLDTAGDLVLAVLEGER